MVITILKFLPWAILGLAVLFGGHYFLYFSFVKFFNLDSLKIKMFLLVIIFLLSLIFVASSFLAHARAGLFVKIFYAVSASWIGVAVNLFLAACLIWLTIGFAQLAGFNPNKPVLGAAMLGLAVLFSVYGIWNAFHSQIKNIDLTIKNLPPQWQNKAIVQISDVHLGNIHGQKFLRDIVDKINAQNPDLVLITGDLFDGMDGDLDVFIETLNNIQSKNGIFFVTGNHETYLGLDIVFSLLKKTRIKILDNELADLNGLQIIGIGYPTAEKGLESFIGNGQSDTEKIMTSLKNFNPAKPSILLHHAPTNIAQAKAAGIGLQLSGHTHDGQIFPFGLIAELIYGKYNYGLHTEGNFSIFTSSGAGTWGPPMRTGNAPEIVVFKIK